MKDRKKKLSAKKQRELEKEIICREILCHAQFLAEEINVRQFLETGTGEMLFVECVTITEIRFPDSRKNIFGKVGAWLKQTWKRFRRFLRW